MIGCQVGCGTGKLVGSQAGKQASNSGLAALVIIAAQLIQDLGNWRLIGGVASIM